MRTSTERVVGRILLGVMRGEMPGHAVLVEVVEMDHGTILVRVDVLLAVVLVVHVRI